MTALSRVQVCDACLAGVQAQTGALCDRCGDDLGAVLGGESLRFAMAMGVRTCTMCRLAPPEFARAVAFAPYDNEIREMLHLLKFEGNRDLVRALLGARLADAMLLLAAEAAQAAIVIPVPLFATRERERGFNQATVLARSALERLRKIHPEWKLELKPKALERVKDTRALFLLNPAQRRRSLKGAFRIGETVAVRGREVLLVDDIMTTGATARECARVLLRAGAAKVWVVTLAKAQPERTWSADGTSESADVARWSVGVEGGRDRHEA